MVREGVPRARGPHAAVDLARRPHGLGARRRALAHQPLYRPQGGLGLRRGDHRVHSFLRDLDHASQDRHRAHAHDRLGEQLHAVHGELRGLFHGRHAHLSLRGLHADQQQRHVPADHARVGVLPLGARRHDGDSDEAPDDQRRAASLSQRHRRGRNAQCAPLGRRVRDALGPRAGLGRHARHRQQVLDRRSGGHQREARALHDRHVGGRAEPARVRPRVDWGAL